MRRVIRATVAIMSAGVLTATLWAVMTPTEVAGSASQSQLTGEELAASMGLELESSMPADCNDFVEVADPVGYCLDGHVSSVEESWDVGRRLRGYTPTGLEKEIFSTSREMMQAVPGSAEFVNLAQRLINLKQQLEAETSGK